MKGFNYLLYALAAVIMMTGCIGETEESRGSSLFPDDEVSIHAKREILLTLDNKLVLKSDNATRAEGLISTEAENAIDALDVFAFGSLTEAGPYSYLQRFAYRADKSKMPMGATELNLNISGAKGDRVNASFSLPKGFFVKLYCVANREVLLNPADHKVFGADKYVPIDYTSTENGVITVLAQGVPTEETFKTFYTPLINPENTGEVILPPLPMSGGLVTSLDMQDNKASSHLNASLRLTRSVARFDVRNNPEFTRLTIESVSMANGRKGVSLFPIQVYGSQPIAGENELVTYPARSFTKEDKINVDYRAGAFYSYPCLVEDGAFLIIKGKYRINKTESKDVVYSVPFKQTLENVHTSSTWIEIQANHRYTINILDADEYDLRCNLSVADWNDEGSIDDYNPDNTLSNFSVDIPDAMTDKVTYEPTVRTAYMGLEDGSTFFAMVKTNSTLQVITSYQDNVQDCNWLTVSEPKIKPVIGNDKYAHEYTYTVTLNKEYAGNRFPRATFRFIDLATGEGQILFVRLTGTPILSELTEWPADIPEVSKINSFNINTKTASLYLVEGSQLPFKVICSDEIETEATLPDYLELTQLSKEGDETVYNLKVKTSPVTKAAVDQVKITFVNKNVTTQKQTLAVKVLSAGVSVPEGNLTVDFAAGEQAFKSGISSPQGFSVNSSIDWNGGDAWFDLVTTGDVEAGDNKSVGIKVKSGLITRTTANTKAATVTLTNKIKGAASASFTVVPAWLTPGNGAGQATSIYIVIKGTGSITVQVPYGGINVSSSSTSVATVSTNSSTGVITVTGVAVGSATVTVSNAQDNSKSKTYAVSIKAEKYTVKESERILIGNLYWTKGNLIAYGTHGCRVGAESDYGLHFRWGSLIGYDVNNSATNPTAVVYPEEYTPGAVVFSSSPGNGNPNSAVNLSAGTGDPCKAYLAGNWRMPTENECRNNLGGGVQIVKPFKVWEWTTVGGKTGIKTGPNKQIFFPAAGVRDINGTLNAVGIYVYIWSSTLNNSSSAFHIFGSQTEVCVSDFGRTRGRNIRCVQAK